MDRGSLSAAELLAVADLWKRTRRTVEARFAGDSMEPTIPSGARLRLSCGMEVAAGDVVAFVHDGHVLVHRVLAIAPPLVLTRGDGLVIPDPPVSCDRVFARVEALQRGDDWTAPAGPRESAAQRLLRWLCAFRLGTVWARVLIGALRRLRPRPAEPAEVLE